MADTIYDEYKKALAGAPTHSAVDFDTDTIKVALLTSSYSINASSHVDFADVVGSESSGSAYTTGGVTLGSKTITTTSNITKMDGDDATWSTSTIADAQYGVVYKFDTSNAISPLICVFDFGSAKSTTNADFTIQWGANGILRFKTGT